MSEGFVDERQARLVGAGLAGLTALFAHKIATPLDVVEAYLSRIQRLDRFLNAFVYVDREGALRDAAGSAARWAAGTPLSPMDGAPLGVKANIAVRGMPWHGGIGAYRERIADHDADVVTALRRGGAVVIGLLNMHEAALGATTDNPAFGRCHNPFRRDYTPGGSSGGSAAAVSAGLCAAALGTDTMGSVRIPASYCGVVGHMPERGRISTRGVIPLAWTLDQVGLLSRSAEDAFVATRLLCGEAADFVPPVETGPIRAAALDLSQNVDLDPSVAQGFEAILERASSAGLSVTRIRLPSYDVVAMQRDCLLIAEVEGFVEHEAALGEDPGGFSPALTKMLAWGGRQSAPKLARAYRRLALTADRIRGDLAGFDALVSPTTPKPAFPFGAPIPSGQADFTLIGNIAGWAATAFPAGLSADSLPVSAQVLSPSWEAALSLASKLAQPVSPPGPFRWDEDLLERS